MTDYQDRVLDGDGVARYDLVAKDGTVVAKDVELVLATPISREGDKFGSAEVNLLLGKVSGKPVLKVLSLSGGTVDGSIECTDFIKSENVYCAYISAAKVYSQEISEGGTTLQNKYATKNELSKSIDNINASLENSVYRIENNIINLARDFDETRNNLQNQINSIKAHVGM